MSQQRFGASDGAANDTQYFNWKCRFVKDENTYIFKEIGGKATGYKETGRTATNISGLLIDIQHRSLPAGEKDGKPYNRSEMFRLHLETPAEYNSDGKRHVNAVEFNIDRTTIDVINGILWRDSEASLYRSFLELSCWTNISNGRHYANIGTTWEFSGRDGVRGFLWERNDPAIPVIKRTYKNVSTGKFQTFDGFSPREEKEQWKHLETDNDAWLDFWGGQVKILATTIEEERKAAAPTATATAVATETDTFFPTAADEPPVTEEEEFADDDLPF